LGRDDRRVDASGKQAPDFNIGYHPSSHGSVDAAAQQFLSLNHGAAESFCRQ